MKSSAIVAHPVHVVLLKFTNEYKKSLIESGHSPVAFLPVETEKCQGTGGADIGGPEDYVYDYSTSQLLRAEQSVQVTRGTVERERKMRTL